MSAKNPTADDFPPTEVPVDQTRQKTVGGTYSQEYVLHINEETSGTVEKHPNTDVFTENCAYCALGGDD